MKKSTISLIILVFLLISCKKEQTEVTERGGIVSTREIGTYAPSKIQSLLDLANFEPPFTLAYSVRAVKIEYMTPRPDGELMHATGAVFIPETAKEFPVISYQHGTQTQRYQVPSLGLGISDAGLAPSVAASMGYVCIAADYLGLGDSYIVPPYLLAENTANTVIDMLRAGFTYLSDQGVETDGSLYLTGYSQGGQVTMATHHEIEKNHSDEFQVTASAPLAGPYDLEATIDTVIAWGRYKRPILMAYLMNSYNYYYGWNRLSEIFQEPWASEIPEYFDGSQSMDAINYRLPQALDSLLLESFLNDYKTGGETEFRNAVRENSLLNYVPDGPVLLIHGNADKTVPISNSLAALEYYESQGKTNVELLTVEGDHQTAAEAAIVGAMIWFQSLREK